MAADLTSAATLLFRSGEERDFPLPKGPEITIGFAADNSLTLRLTGVSRKHARLLFDGQSYWIEDLGSANGTFLNGQRISKRRPLEHLDVVTFGRHHRLIFVRKASSPRVLRTGIRNAWLESLQGPEEGTRHEIPRGSLTIGRSPVCNVVARGHLISKQHARIERRDVQLSLTDLQSSNGTFVNGERVGFCVLKDGDEISVAGKPLFRVRIEEGPVETGEPAGPPADVPPVNLPTDWKTRVDWSPEDRALIQEAVADPGRPRSEPVTPSIVPPTDPSGRADSAAANAGSLSPAPSGIDAGIAETNSLSAGSAAAVGSVLARPGAQDDSAMEETVDTRPAPGRDELPGPVFFEGGGFCYRLEPGVHEVGRAPGCSILIESELISRRHARIIVSPEGISLEDLGSANGTFVNGGRLASTVMLSSGDAIHFGETGFRVRFADTREPNKGGGTSDG